MAKYTMELRTICEDYAGVEELTGGSKINEIISVARSKVFDFQYPIFDEAYKIVLETKILKRFYMWEIGGETVAIWKFWLDRKMNEIMPYYNQLYKSELLKFNPLYDFDITRKHNTKNNGSKTDNEQTSSNSTINGSGSNITKSKNLFSDTGQGTITNLENGSYLTNATIDDDNTQTTRTDTSTNTGTASNNTITSNIEDYLEQVSGKQGGVSYSKMLQEYRDTFLNIDIQIINELYDLFMGVW